MNSTKLRVNRLTLSLISLYFLWQLLMPLRHLLIAGDCRTTFEGLSFSWRLKADVYRAAPCKITILDTGIISTNKASQVQLNWKNWTREDILYRQIPLGAIPWNQLPEIMILFDVELGERILFNPLGSPQPVTTSLQAARRIAAIWKPIYGRTPTSVRTVQSIESIEKGYRAALKISSNTTIAPDSSPLRIFMEKHGKSGDGKGLKVLRRMAPFSDPTTHQRETPFLFIEDEPLLETQPDQTMKLRRAAWKFGPHLQCEMDYKWKHIYGTGIVIHTPDFDFENRALFPQACLVHYLGAIPEAPLISWDYLRDLGPSKSMHISSQPFLLQRYARWLADSWERDHKRRPEIRAATQMSFNFRPFQTLVKESVDLASVPVKRFSHNDWITSPSPEPLRNQDKDP
jgi:hypothetical protein